MGLKFQNFPKFFYFSPKFFEIDTKGLTFLNLVFCNPTWDTWMRKRHHDQPPHPRNRFCSSTLPGRNFNLSGTKARVHMKITSFFSNKGYDFMIEFSFTTFDSREELVEMVVKHNDDVLISGDRIRFRSLFSNIKSTTGRYG